MQNNETKRVFIVWTNTDLTEGRGYQVPLHVCEIEATARRLAKRAGVMGSDADVSPFDAILHRGNWCAPFQFSTATAADKAEQVRIDARDAAIQKARDAGLSMEDLRALGVCNG